MDWPVDNFKEELIERKELYVNGGQQCMNLKVFIAHNTQSVAVVKELRTVLPQFVVVRGFNANHFSSEMSECI